MVDFDKKPVASVMNPPENPTEHDAALVPVAAAFAGVDKTSNRFIASVVERQMKERGLFGAGPDPTIVDYSARLAEVGGPRNVLLENISKEEWDNMELGGPYVVVIAWVAEKRATRKAEA